MDISKANNNHRFKAIVGLVKEYIADTKDVMSTLLGKSKI